MVLWLGLGAFTAGARVQSQIPQATWRGQNRPPQKNKERKRKKEADPVTFFPLANVAILEHDKNYAPLINGQRTFSTHTNEFLLSHGDFPGGPVVKTLSALPLNGTRVPSLVGEFSNALAVRKMLPMLVTG